MCICVSALVKRLKDVCLQHVFEAMIIVANHDISDNGQSEVIKNPLNSAQNACGKFWYHHIFKISVPTVPIQ